MNGVRPSFLAGLAALAWGLAPVSARAEACTYVEIADLDLEELLGTAASCDRAWLRAVQLCPAPHGSEPARRTRP